MLKQHLGDFVKLLWFWRVWCIYKGKEGCGYIKWWDGGLDRIGRVGPVCRTLNLLIASGWPFCQWHHLPSHCHEAQCSWLTCTGLSLGWEGVTVGVGLKGWDFLVTLLQAFQTTPGSPGHLHPLRALIPTKV